MYVVTFTTDFEALCFIKARFMFEKPDAYVQNKNAFHEGLRKQELVKNLTLLRESDRNM